MNFKERMEVPEIKEAYKELHKLEKIKNETWIAWKTLSDTCPEAKAYTEAYNEYLAMMDRITELTNKYK